MVAMARGALEERVKAIQKVARSLGVQTVAECVETEQCIHYALVRLSASVITRQ